MGNPLKPTQSNRGQCFISCLQPSHGYMPQLTENLIENGVITKKKNLHFNFFTDVNNTGIKNNVCLSETQ